MLHSKSLGETHNHEIQKRFSITEDQFSAIKDKTIRGYENFSLSDAHQQTRERGYNVYDDVNVAETASVKNMYILSRTEI